LNGITGFSNFLNYLDTNNIAIDNLGIAAMVLKWEKILQQLGI
jgi:hypothetical protein